MGDAYSTAVKKSPRGSDQRMGLTLDSGRRRPPGPEAWVNVGDRVRDRGAFFPSFVPHRRIGRNAVVHGWAEVLRLAHVASCVVLGALLVRRWDLGVREVVRKTRGVTDGAYCASAFA